MVDRRITEILNVMSIRVTPACLYGTQTLAMTELQQQRPQVCENNWLQKTARVTRADVERMADDRLPKRAAELREQASSRRGRPRLRWEDCVRIDVMMAAEEDD